MSIPLILLHIPALVAYLKTDHVSKDMYAVRKNACSVLKEYVTLASGLNTRLDHAELVRQAIIKCKKDASDAGSLAYSSLLIMHEALNKKTPPIESPADSDDGGGVDAWKHESSFIRELCGMQLSHPALGITHPFVVDVRLSKEHTLSQGIRDVLGNTTRIQRPPLILVCLPHARMTFTLDLTFDIRYTLDALATDTHVYTCDGTRWVRHDQRTCSPVSLEQLRQQHPKVLVYRRV